MKRFGWVALFAFTWSLASCSTLSAPRTATEWQDCRDSVGSGPQRAEGGDRHADARRPRGKLRSDGGHRLSEQQDVGGPPRPPLDVSSDEVVRHDDDSIHVSRRGAERPSEAAAVTSEASRGVDTRRQIFLPLLVTSTCGVSTAVRTSRPKSTTTILRSRVTPPAVRVIEPEQSRFRL